MGLPAIEVAYVEGRILRVPHRMIPAEGAQRLARDSAGRAVLPITDESIPDAKALLVAVAKDYAARKAGASH